MKYLLIISFSLSTALASAQNYFNTIEPDQKNKVVISKDTVLLEQETAVEKKDKLYYTYRLKKLTDDLKALEKEFSIKDSINNKNIDYFNRKLNYIGSKKKRKSLSKEIEFIEIKKKNESESFNAKKRLIENKIFRTKDTLYNYIKDEIKKKHSSLNPNAIPENIKPPIKGNVFITSKYGNRIHPISNKKKFHTGIDIRAKNVKVFSSLPGKVTKVDYSKTLGIYVEIKHKDDFTTIYGHLSKILVLENETVDNTKAIAISGNTGGSTAPHLHFTIKKANNYLNPNDIFSNLL